MTQEIKKTAAILTDYIDEIIAGNTDKSFINRAELGFGDPDNHCSTSEFKRILDKHFKTRNVTYTCKRLNIKSYHFDITLHDCMKDEKNKK